MKLGFLGVFTILVFVGVSLGIGALVFFPAQNGVEVSQSQQQARVVVPRVPDFRVNELDLLSEIFVIEDDLTSKVPLEDGEIVVAVLTDFFDGGPVEKQFVAYRNLVEVESPIHLTFIDYDMATRSYVRQWNARTVATRPGTVRLQTMDLLGDRSLCILVFGMNRNGENTISIFRRNDPQTDEYFTKIFELAIDGTITVRETVRSWAQQGGQDTGGSFAISAFGRDLGSANILDQVEIVFAYNELTDAYEESDRTRIPGSQVEQRRVRELLGNARLFEQFVSGLWYHESSSGAGAASGDRNQYIYFDPPSREIIFYGDGIQQIFNWRNSTATRYGLHIFGQNVSVANLRRSINIELESLDTIRINVREDIRLSVAIGAPWDGTYRKVNPPERRAINPPARTSRINAAFDSRIGRIDFHPNGTFELSSSSNTIQGRYIFFDVNGEELLELRPDDRSEFTREVFLVESEDQDGNMLLSHVRIGSRGITRLHERPVALTLVD